MSVVLFTLVILMCFVYCWGHISGYRDACHRYRILINDYEPY